MLFAILFPILMNNFKGPVKPIHLELAIYSHFLLAVLGILVGTFFSVTSFASRKYTWLSAVFVIVVSLAYEGITGKVEGLKWGLFLFPPVVNVIKYLSGNDQIHIEVDFWLSTAWVFVYTIITIIFVNIMFLRKER